MSEYHFREIEQKWQQRWAEQKTYRTENGGPKPKYYVLDMFPYPSGAGLHVGHPLGYIASDIVARFKKLKGFNVLHPMGYDAFGLPAEQYAIQTGQHPAITTKNNIERYREQLDKIGLGYDWDREIRTCEKDYYKWTQWIFIQLFNSWYNPATDKAENISTLIHIFETRGFKGSNDSILTGDIEIERDGFTPAQWADFGEATRESMLQHFRLAYLSEAYVNWCPAMGTVLANDEVKDGVSERGGYPVERKLMKQWSLRITAYADRLLRDLDTIEWSDSIKEAQRNWIGKSEGCSLKFKVENSSREIEVFTTRPDTIFGVSFVTLAPELELVNELATPEYKAQVDAYVHYAKNRSERERQTDVKKITGQFTGAYALHPFTGKQIPIWIGEYVLAGYGTGCVMGVPAHDSRDFGFATHFGIPKQQVIQPAGEWNFEEASYDAKEGTLINSDFLNGLEVKSAIKKAIEAVEAKGLGQGKTNYRLRDAVFGRQRYWGEPIPVYYKDEIPYVMPESALPLELPEVDKFLPTEDGEPPLARAKNWVYQQDGKEYPIETTTMPGWAASSWYYLRYMDNKNPNVFVSKEAIDYWQQVDLYLGGSEHATGHLLYVRFWTKFLFDLGYLPFTEPAKKLVNQGMIIAFSNYVYVNRKYKIAISSDLISSFDIHQIDKDIINVKDDVEFLLSQIENTDCLSNLNLILSDTTFSSRVHSEPVLEIETFVKAYPEFHDFKFISNSKGNFICQDVIEKMSKSKLNVVNPDDVINQYGADTLRLYEMFLGPLEQSKPWSTQGIEGVSRFLRKLWRLFFDEQGNLNVSDAAPEPKELKSLHKTIKKVEEDIDNLSFNTSVSAFMVCVNELTDLKCNKREVLEQLLVTLSSFAPHICEELWSRLGHTESITKATYPTFNAAYLIENSFSYPVSINGKVRTNIDMELSLDAAAAEQIVLADATVQKWLEGKAPKKVIFVKGRIVNIVL
ncbi:MAG: leucine--tRNA ligase [Bacteroidia bacterium]|nr:leucine--tRNA ligase [Bacteroidia bacterium]MBP7260463.1 leucine--tRNA ligase [Bacteroidia bacterium]MBP9179295.1 leucine--tRNA ligase [Bacteroidia bacterium]MBP9724072.1 leucine--tRNA ligase [Bacteroidia bacterium]